MKELIARTLKQMMTGADNATFDPARVIGYGSAALGVLVFLFNSVWVTVKTGGFDAVDYGTGFGAVCAGIMAVGIGVGVKAHAEPGKKEGEQ